MSFFAVHYAYTSDSAALDAARAEHRAYLGSLVEQGSLAASGPYVAAEPSALLLFRADSADDVRALLDHDPFQIAGLVEQTTITQWNPILGVFASELE